MFSQKQNQSWVRLINFFRNSDFWTKLYFYAKLGLTKQAGVAELVDARDLKSLKVSPCVGSSPTFGTS